MAEKWKDIYSKEQLDKLQKVEFKMLNDFDKVCKKMNLTYVLYGGTLLGAYKYQGFIPWDDDVDIAMERIDYDNFIQNASSFLGDEYILQTPYNEPRSPFAYCKLRLKGTRYIEKFHHTLNIEQGIYLDIYPIDEIPDDEILRKTQFDKAQRLFKAYYYKQCLHVDSSTPLIPKIKQIIAFWILKFVPQKVLMRLIDKNLKKYNGMGYKRKSCLYYPKYENIYERYQPMETVIFNHKEFCAPGDYIEHLKRRYGDITSVPPENERVGHRPYIFELGD